MFSLVDTITEGSWHLLFIYYWLTHSLFLLLLAQLHRLDTSAHEQIAIEVAAGWKLDICHFQQGVWSDISSEFLWLITHNVMMTELERKKFVYEINYKSAYLEKSTKIKNHEKCANYKHVWWVFTKLLFTDETSIFTTLLVIN